MRDWLKQRGEGILDEALGSAVWFLIVAFLVGGAVAGWQIVLHASGPTIALTGLIAGGAMLFVLNQAAALSTRSRTTRKALGKEQRIALNAIRNGTLEMREHCGVSWRGAIRDGVIRVRGPYCPEDDEELEYKQRFPRLSQLMPAEPIGPRLGPSTLSPPEVALPPLSQLNKQEEETDEDRWLRPLREDDTSDEESGPYCRKCKRLRRMPSRVGDCRMELVRQIEADLVIVA